MYKPPKNPQVIELTKSYKERQFAVGQLKHIIRDDGTKGCIWCGDTINKHPAQRYCKDKMCPESTYAWGYPQKEQGLNFLLLKQNFLCNLCGYDWKPIIEDRIVGKFYGTKKGNYKVDPNWYVMKRLKGIVPNERAPEVDHIVPISKGGTSLGLDNHQAICYTCHKAKSKVDNSGPRKKK